jgi:hypothetical protein
MMENDTLKTSIEAIKSAAGDDPQEQIKALEAMIFKLADLSEKNRARAERAEPFLDIWVKASREYFSKEHMRFDERAKACLRILNIVPTPGRKQDVNPELLLWEFIELVSDRPEVVTGKETEKMSKKEALKYLTERHGLYDEKACLKRLQKHLRKRRKESGDNSWLKGLIPYDSGYQTCLD